MSNSVESPASRLAALLALEAGLKDQIATAKRDVLAVAEAAGAKSLAFETPWGPVNVTRKEGGIVVTDDRALLAWVKENRPDEVETVETVRPAFMKHLREERWTVVKGEVVDTKTGEIVPFAEPGEPGEPYPAWPATKGQREAKEYARMLFADNAQRLTSALRLITTGEE